MPPRSPAPSGSLSLCVIILLRSVRDHSQTGAIMNLRYLAMSAAAIGVCALAACGSPEPVAASRPSAIVSTTPATVSTTSATTSTTPSRSPAPAGTDSCAAQVKTWYLTSGRTEIRKFHTTVADLVANENGGPLATTEQLGRSLVSDATPGDPNVPMPACGDPAHAWPATLVSYTQAGNDVFHDNIAASAKAINAGNASLEMASGEIARFTPLS